MGGVRRRGNPAILTFAGLAAGAG
ncbi:hypothetical protein EMIT0111MI5_50382 [Burkholderia sp. IT-111MI5]